MNPLDDAADRLAQRHVTDAGDESSFFGDLSPGAEIEDSPVLARGQPGRLADHLGGCHQLLYFLRDDRGLSERERQMLHALLRARTPILPLLVSRRGMPVPGFESLTDVDGELARRCDARAGTSYLLDPTGQLVARWRRLDLDAVGKAMAQHTGWPTLSE